MSAPAQGSRFCRGERIQLADETKQISNRHQLVYSDLLAVRSAKLTKRPKTVATVVPN